MANELYHYGVPHDKSTVGRGSGRYPWGSGKNPRAARNIKINGNISINDKESIKKGKEIIDRYMVKGPSSIFYSTLPNKETKNTTWGDYYNIDVVFEGKNEKGAEIYYTPARFIKDAKKNNNENTPNELKIDYNYSLFDAEDVNPDFGAPGTTANCPNCTAALELRKKGYNVSAGHNLNGCWRDWPELWFDGAEKNNYTKENLIESLEKQGKGASGTLDFNYKSGSGHVIHYDVFEDGKVRFEDGQNGRIYDPTYDYPYNDKDYSSIDEFFDSYVDIDFDKGFGSYRLDKAEPNWDALSSDGALRMDVKKYGKYNSIFSRKTNKVYNNYDYQYFV